jgi:hypothetical protein
MISGIILFGSAESTMHLPESLVKGLLGFHSGWRYIILLLLILGIWFAFQALKGKKPYIGTPKRMGMFTMIAMDLQLLAGALLYFNFLATQTNFKLGKLTDQLGVGQFRSIIIDHGLGMFIALLLVHIGYAKAKRNADPAIAGKKQFTFFLIALILILLSIPWPFLGDHYFRGWF